MKSTQGRLGRSFLFIAMVLLLGHNVLAWFAPKTRADGSGVFATGRYRSLFAESGHPQKESLAKIDAAFQQPFRADPETQSLVFTAGKNANGPLDFLTHWNNHDVPTDGMSYGMMIAAQLDKKAEFDALWIGRKPTCTSTIRSTRRLVISHGRARRTALRMRKQQLPMGKNTS